MVVVFPAPLPPRSPVTDPPRARMRYRPPPGWSCRPSPVARRQRWRARMLRACRSWAARSRRSGAVRRAKRGRQDPCELRADAIGSRGIRPRLSTRSQGVHCRHGRTTRRGSPRTGRSAPRHARAAALARGGRPDHRCAGGLFRPRLRAADLGLPRRHRLAAWLNAAHSLPDDATARARPGGLVARLRHRRAGGAAVLHRRAAEPLRIPVSRTGSDLGQQRRRRR